MLRFKTILHPTDFSETAIQSMHLAQSLARDHGAELVVLAVGKPPTPFAALYTPDVEMMGLIKELRLQVASLIETINDVTVRADAVQGLPGQAIVSVADEIHADLIVMGTHGRTGLLRLMMGSVAEYVMQHAHCPVITLRPAIPRPSTEQTEKPSGCST
jgi:universal stress protein A